MVNHDIAVRQEDLVGDIVSEFLNSLLGDANNHTLASNQPGKLYKRLAISAQK